jgi:drug/metabolite transporter (DMT)-like permease
MTSPLGLIYAFAYTAIFAASNIMLRSLARTLSPSLVIGLRAVIGVLFVVPIALLTAPQDYALLTPERLLYLCGSVAIGGVIGSTANVYSLRTVGVARSFPISNASPLFTMLFGVWLLGEPIAARMVPGALLVLAGAYLIVRPSRQPVQGAEPPLSRRDAVLGFGAAVLAAVAWGLTAVVLSLGIQGINPIVANSVRVPVVATLSMVTAWARGDLPQMRTITRSRAALLLLAGTVGYGLLSTLYVTAVQVLGPSLTQIIGTTAPLFGLAMGMSFMNERPTRMTALGTLLTIAGIVLVL